MIIAKRVSSKQYADQVTATYYARAKKNVRRLCAGWHDTTVTTFLYYDKECTKLFEKVEPWCQRILKDGVYRVKTWTNAQKHYARIIVVETAVRTVKRGDRILYLQENIN